MNEERFESMRHIIDEESREIATITEMRGIENELVLNAFENEDNELPKIPKLTVMTQTDKELYQDMNPDIPLSDVKAYHKINALEKELQNLKKKKGINKDNRIILPDDCSNSEDYNDVTIKKKKKIRKHKDKDKGKSKNQHEQEQNERNIRGNKRYNEDKSNLS